jgi:iron complex transport system ATP-binding protein
VTTPLQITNLSVGYGVTPIATDINFALAEKESLAILGPNGAGKTTLFRTLLSLIPALHGEILINGASTAQLGTAEIARAIAYVPQQSALFAGFTVMDVVLMSRAPHLAWYAQPGAADRALAAHWLSTVNMSPFALRDFATLSGGERQLVLLARALTSGAKVLLLDEPTASLDFGNQIRVMDALNALRSDGFAILYTTHHPTEAAELADRTMTINRDGTFAIDKTARMLTREKLAALYGVPESRLQSRLQSNW